MAITTSNFISDSTLLLRSVIASGISDPISGSRNSASKFVLTNHPTRNIEWPHIIVKQGNITSRRLGLASEQQFVNMPFEVRIWGRNQTEKDSLTQSTINTLRTGQFNSGSGTVELSMFGFAVESAVDVDETDGMSALKSKILRVNYQAVLTG